MKLTPETATREFALRLAAARKAAGFQYQKDLADALGVEHETYRRWERGETEPSLFHLRKIALITNVTLDYLLSGKSGGRQTVARRAVNS